MKSVFINLDISSLFALIIIFKSMVQPQKQIEKLQGEPMKKNEKDQNYFEKQQPRKTSVMTKFSNPVFKSNVPLPESCLVPQASQIQQLQKSNSTALAFNNTITQQQNNAVIEGQFQSLGAGRNYEPSKGMIEQQNQMKLKVNQNRQAQQQQHMVQVEKPAQMVNQLTQMRSLSQKSMSRPSTATLPPRNNRRVQVQEGNSASLLPPQPPHMNQPLANQNIQQVQSAINTAPRRRPVSAIARDNNSAERFQGSGQGTISSILPKQGRIGSAMSRDARSVSSFFHDTAKSSNMKRSRKKKKGIGSKVQTKQMGQQKAELNKKFARNAKLVVQQINNLTGQNAATPDMASTNENIQEEDPSSYPTYANNIQSQPPQQIVPTMPVTESPGQACLHLSEQGPSIGSGRDPQQLVYMVHNYYGGWNNHNYNQANQQESQQNSNQQNPQQQSQQQFDLQPQQMILAQNQTPKQEVQRLEEEVNELQERKRQLMNRKMPKKPRNKRSNLARMMINVPIPIRDRGDEPFYEQHRRQQLDDSDSDADDTVMNRSYSVDTSHYRRHLKRKGKNFQVMRGMSLDHQSVSPGPHLSKLERQYYVMQYLENANTRNAFRSLKMKDLMDKHGREAKRELRQMLQQEEDWNSLSADAYSDDQTGSYMRTNKKKSRRRNDFGNYQSSEDVNYYQKQILHNDHYKRLQQLKAGKQEGDRSKSKSKSPSRLYSNSSPVPGTNLKTAHSAAKLQNNPLAQTIKHGISASQPQLILKHYKSEKAQKIIKKFEKDLAQRGSQQNLYSSKPRLIAKKFIEATPKSEARPKNRDRSRSRSKKTNRTKNNVQAYQDDHDIDSAQTTPYKKKRRNELQQEHSNLLIEDDAIKSQIMENLNEGGPSSEVKTPEPQLDQKTPSELQDANIREQLEYYKNLAQQLEKSRKVNQQYQHQKTEQPVRAPLVEVLYDSETLANEGQKKRHRKQFRSSEKLALNETSEQRISHRQSDGIVHEVGGRDRALSSSLMTETALTDIMSASQAGNTTKSFQPTVVQPQQLPLVLATIQEQSEIVANYDGANYGDGWKAFTPIANTLKVDKYDSQLRSQSNSQIKNEHSPSHQMMFDIGEPSQASDQAYAMLNMDANLNTSSHRISSMSESHSIESHSIKEEVKNETQELIQKHQGEGYNPKIDVKNKNSQEPEDTKEDKIENTQSQIEQQRPRQEDSCKSLSCSRPPLLKMRTQVVGRKEHNKQTFSKHDTIEGSKEYESRIGGGGPFLSEQQNSIYQKAESSAKVTSKGQAWGGAVSVHQILAASAAQNESTKHLENTLQQQMGSLFLAAGNLHSVEELHNDASPTVQVPINDGGFNAQVAQVQKNMEIKEEQDQNLRQSEQSSFIEETLSENEQQESGLSVALSPLSRRDGTGKSKPIAFDRDGEDSPDTSNQNLLSMFNQVESNMAKQKKLRNQQVAEGGYEESRNHKIQQDVVELMEAGTQTLKNMSAQTDQEDLYQHQTASFVETKQTAEHFQRQEPTLPLQVVKEENYSVITDSPIDETHSASKKTTQLPSTQAHGFPRQGTIYSNNEQHGEINKLVTEATETAKLAQKLLDQQQQQMALQQQQQEQIYQQQQKQLEFQQEQIEQQKKVVQIELEQKRARGHKESQIVLQEEHQSKKASKFNKQPEYIRESLYKQQEVIVCSPFEQDMFEMLALAAIKPKREVAYTDVLIDELPESEQAEHGDLQRQMVRLFESQQTRRGYDVSEIHRQAALDDLKMFENLAEDDADDEASFDLWQAEAPVEIVAKQASANDSKRRRAKDELEAIQESVNISTQRSNNQSYEPQITIDGTKFKLNELIRPYHERSAQNQFESNENADAEEDTVSVRSEQTPEPPDISLDIVENKVCALENDVILEASIEHDDDSISRSSMQMLDKQELHEEQSATQKLPKLAFKLPTFNDRSSSDQLTGAKRKLSFQRFKSTDLPVMDDSKSPSTPQNLKRLATQIPAPDDFKQYSRVKEDYEIEKNKILARFVDTLFIDDRTDKRECHEDENLHDLLELSGEQLVMSQRSYWAIEMDCFGFENFAFSIVNAEQVYQHEHRILYLENWSTRMRQKPGNAMVLTKMATFQAINKKQSIGSKKGPNKKSSEIEFKSMNTLKGDIQSDSIVQTAPGETDSSQSLQNYKKNSLLSRFMPHQEIDQFNIIDLLMKEFPIISRDEFEFRKSKKKAVFIYIDNLVILQSLQIDLKKIQAPQGSKQETSRSSSQHNMLSQFRRVSYKNKKGMSNKWLSTSIYFNDLKNLAGIQQLNESNSNTSSYGAVAPSALSKWYLVDNNLYNSVQSELDERSTVDPTQSRLLIESNIYNKQAGPKVEFRALHRNKFFRLQLITMDRNIVKLNHSQDMPLCQVKLSFSHQSLLTQLINKSSYASYSHHLWSVSQAKKQSYANQGERAQRFFASAMKHSAVGISNIYNESHASMQAFMRRSTIRQEIQDILFVRTSCLLMDQDYVKRENRQFLIQKIRHTIQKSCEADQSNNAYQYQLRMQELDDFNRKDWDDRNDQMIDYENQQQKDHTQFSKSLIFINFHPQSEAKTWIHRDYMSKTIRCDQETPRYYGDYLKKVYEQQSQRNWLMSQMSSAHGIFALHKEFMESNRSTPSQKKGLVRQQKQFPFILNDHFGYLTLMLTDGCYQILVPSQPECRMMISRKGYTNLTPRSGQNSHSANQPQHDETMQISLQSKSGDASPVTPVLTPITFDKNKKRRVQTNDVGYRSTAAQNFSEMMRVSQTPNKMPSINLLKNSDEASNAEGSSGKVASESDLSQDQGDIGRGQPKLSRCQNMFVSGPSRRARTISNNRVGASQFKKCKTENYDIEDISDRSSSGMFTFSISEEEQQNMYENDVRDSDSSPLQRGRRTSQFLRVPGNKNYEECIKRPGVRFSGPIRHDSGSTDSGQNRNFAFQRQGTVVFKKIKKMKMKKSTRLEKHKNGTHIINVMNIKREVINSLEQLKDTRIPSSVQKNLINQGIQPTKRQMNIMNSSMNSPDQRSIRTSPNKNHKRHFGAKKITIVKRMDLQSTININISLANKQKFKHAITLDDKDQEQKQPSILAATLLQLRRMKAEKKLSEYLQERNVADDEKGGVSAAAGHNQSQLQLIKRMSMAVDKQVKRLAEPQVTRSFFKYQIEKPQDSQSLLRMKSPSTRICEKQAYEQKLEAQERRKVFSAIEFNQIQVVEDYIKCHMMGVDATDTHGNTLLSMAAQFGCYNICNLLLKEGANVNSQNKSGNTPLHYAIAYKRSDIVDLLIESGANETIKNKQRLTPWQGV